MHRCCFLLIKYKVALIVLCLAANSQDSVAQTATSNFSDFIGGRFVNVGGSTRIGVEAVFGISITPSHFDVRGAIGNPGFPLGDSDNPGDSRAYFSANYLGGSRVDVDAMTLNFSDSILGFGVTFLHYDLPLSQVFPDAQLELPASLRVYDGLDGTGNLLGTVTSSGLVATDEVEINGERLARTGDFVGIISDQPNIRSAVLEGTATYSPFAVDGYGVAVAVPEPASSLLLLAVLAGCFSIRQRDRGRWAKTCKTINA